MYISLRSHSQTLKWIARGVDDNQTAEESRDIDESRELKGRDSKYSFNWSAQSV